MELDLLRVPNSLLELLTNFISFVFAVSLFPLFGIALFTALYSFITTIKTQLILFLIGFIIYTFVVLINYFCFFCHWCGIRPTRPPPLPTPPPPPTQ